MSRSYQPTLTHWHVPSVMPLALDQMTATGASPTLHKHSHYLDTLTEVPGWQHSAFYLPRVPQPEELEDISPTSSQPQSTHSGHMYVCQGPTAAVVPPSPRPRGVTKSRHQSERRKAQNRQSQRAYRERKEQQLQDVTKRLEELDRKLEDEQSRRQLMEQALASAETKLVDSETRNRLLQQQLIAAKSRNDEMSARWQLLMSKFKQHSSESQIRRCYPDHGIVRAKSPALSTAVAEIEP